MHDNCDGIWCIHGTQHLRLGPSTVRLRVSCRRCGLTVLGIQAWAELDRQAYEQAIDPDGLQRAFMAACVVDHPLPGWAERHRDRPALFSADQPSLFA